MGLGFGVQGLGFRVQGLGFRVQGLGFWFLGLGFGVQGLGSRGMKEEHMFCKKHSLRISGCLDNFYLASSMLYNGILIGKLHMVI